MPYRVGQTATNPKTGQKVQWDGTNWTGVPGTGNGAGGATDSAFKVGDSDSISHTWDIINAIDDAKKLSAKPLSTGTAATAITGIPIIGGLVGQNRANLQTKLGSIAGDLRQIGIRTLYHQTGQKGVGSVARNQAEQQALQNSIAALGAVDDKGHPSGQQPDAATLNQGLDTARSVYYRHLARLYGMSPDDPNAIATISAAYKDPKVRASLLSKAQSQQVTPPPASSTAAPAVNVTPTEPPPLTPAVLKDEGLGDTAVSADTQVVEDPHLKAVGEHITGMLNSGASDEAIRAYAADNGVRNIDTQLGFRREHKDSVGKFTVDPEFYRRHEALSGIRKGIAAVDAVPYVGPAAVGAADTALLGAAPDIAGLVHGVTGAGPTREDVIKARDVSAAESPGSTFAGDMAGAFLNPLGRGGGVGRTALQAALYGGFGSEDPSVSSRLINAGLSAGLGAAAHGATNFALNSVRPVYRAARSAVTIPIVGPEAAATDNALSRAANKMPMQDLKAAADRFQQLSEHGANPPAAAVLNRSGQDYLSSLAQGSPAARAASEEAAGSYRQALPASVAEDFNQAIRDASPDHVDPSKLLNKPVREIANDVQTMASREYEVGMKPIAKQPLKINSELLDTLTHERTNGAIRDALSNHRLDDETRSVLRGLPSQLKAVGGGVPGMNPAAQAAIREKYAQGIPMSVDGARNIATALDNAATKLQEGSEGRVELRRLSSEIRNAIGEQYPEFVPINERYASRKRVLDVLDGTRSNFLSDSPEGMDALAKTAKQYSDIPNEPEFRDPAASPQGAPLPTNRQYAIAGAREAASTKAGAGTGSGAARTAEELSAGPNQQQRSAMVLGDEAAAKIAARSGAKQEVSSVLDRIAKGPVTDQSAKWFNAAKKAVMYKLTGGTAHYAAAYALSSIPGMSSADAARVVRVYTNAQTADQAFNSLSKAYGAAKARTIMSRMVGVATGASYQHSSIGSPVGAQ